MSPLRKGAWRKSGVSSLSLLFWSSHRRVCLTKSRSTHIGVFRMVRLRPSELTALSLPTLDWGPGRKTPFWGPCRPGASWASATKVTIAVAGFPRSHPQPQALTAGQRAPSRAEPLCLMPWLPPTTPVTPDSCSLFRRWSEDRLQGLSMTPEVCELPSQDRL